MAPSIPSGLGSRGRRLWREVTDDHELDASQRVMLEEACRCADRLDRLDDLLRGDIDTWMHLQADEGSGGQVLRIDSALSEARQQQTVLKQLLAALRLPDEASGKRPQQRGGARGAYKPSGRAGAGKVSSLDRARAARTGA